RYVNEAAIGALTMATTDVERLNVTGPEQYSTREAAEKLAAALGKPVTFLDDEGTCGLLSCADKCVNAFGMPDKTVDEMIVMQAEWMKAGGRQLDKPTHFQETKGNF
ncbi:MAG: epimerase, partial [Clostridia bacterium]|nr:epimerase [Clostridia bacterium]